jgi:hypothetical protein
LLLAGEGMQGNITSPSLRGVNWKVPFLILGKYFKCFKESLKNHEMFAA